jgi:hypothetical protein
LNRLAFSRYRKVRIIFWVFLIAGFAFLFLGKPTLFPLLFICAWIAAIISVFMPCPYCGKTIGYRRWGILVAGNAFGGWCLHCGSRLFAITSTGEKKKEGV